MSVMRKPKIGILSLGCPRNLVDAESILGRLNFKGYPIVDINQADIALINTCGFIEEAKKESIDAILDLIELKKKGRLNKVIIYGCLTQRYKDKLRKKIPEVDAFVGSISLNHDSRRFSITPKHYAYLKISEGCINHCSYCVIPEIKGKLISLDPGSVIKRIEEFNRNKVSEVNIIGQDITGYALDLFGAPQLPKLIKSIIKKSENIGWIRLLYLYPSRITDELIELIKNEPKICKYIDLPIQHINDRILKLMHRGTTKKNIFSLIDKIRKEIPEAALRTSVIVGFPTESDEEFKELLNFIEEVRFERLGAFIYSQEEGTQAADMQGQIPKKEKIERFNVTMSSQQKISSTINQKFLRTTMEVLIDEREKDYYLGRTQYDAPEVDGLVYVHAKKTLKPGDFVKVKIKDTLEYDLVGEAH